MSCLTCTFIAIDSASRFESPTLVLNQSINHELFSAENIYLPEQICQDSTFSVQKTYICLYKFVKIQLYQCRKHIFAWTNLSRFNFYSAENIYLPEQVCQDSTFFNFYESTLIMKIVACKIVHTFQKCYPHLNLKNRLPLLFL